MLIVQKFGRNIKRKIKMETDKTETEFRSFKTLIFVVTEEKDFIINIKMAFASVLKTSDQSPCEY